MKRIITFVLAAAFALGNSAQELDSLKAIMENKTSPDKVEKQESQPSYPVYVEEDGDQVKIQVFDKEILKVIDGNDSTYVKVGAKAFLEVSEQPDSTRIRVGDKVISIVERGNEPVIRFSDIDNNEHKGKPRFRGHWAGFEWGINNFMDDDFTLSREGEDQFMDLNMDRSWAINLNFAQFSLGFGTSHTGILTGMGLEFNNYFFDQDNSIVEINDQVVELPDTIGGMNKSKLTTSFLRVPLLLEVQFPRTLRSKRVFLSGGLITGLKLGSHTKVIYKNDRGKSKDKNNDDFNINPFRYGVTARLGYGAVNVFGDYYFTPMFVAGKGPALHPFTLGLSLTF